MGNGVRGTDGLVGSGQTLRENEAPSRRWGPVFEDAVLEGDRDGRITYANRACLRVFGYSPDEIVADPPLVFGLLHDDWKPQMSAFWAEHKRSNTFPDHLTLWAWRRRDGQVVYTENLFTLLKDDRGAIRGFRTVGRDVTERIRTEQQLRRRTAELQALLRVLPDLYFRVDPDYRFVDFHGSAAHLYSSPAQFLGKRVDQVLPADIAQRIIAAMDEARANGGVCTVEYALPYQARLARFEGYVTMDDTGHFVTLVRSLVDRDRLELAVERGEMRFLALVEEASDGIFVFDAAGALHHANRRGLELLGMSLAEAIGRAVADLLGDQAAARLMDDCRLSDKPVVRALAMRRRDGAAIDVEVSAKRLADARTLWFVRDITERRRSEQQELRAQKLESLGILAGGIAHDFNNILTGVIGSLALARMHLGTADKAELWLRESEAALARARGLTQQLLTFARGGSPVKKPVDVRGLLREATTFALRGSNVNCDFSLPDKLPAVEADKGQIEQVVHNLVLNAVQAMPQGGNIQVAADVQAISGEDGPLRPGSYVHVEVRDTGQGIPVENLSKIFDPYFTTKASGSGLGLATAYSILKRHDAHIEVSSAAGKGTTFHVYLPATDRPPPSDAPPRPDAGAAPRSSKRVLVMDDESLIRDVASQLLAHLGYESATASTCVEAVRMFEDARERGRPFDVIILDLTMPGEVGGKEVIRQLQAIDPAVRAIVSSGYSNDPVMSEHRRYGFVGVVAKPYTEKELEHALLEAESAGADNRVE